MNKKDFFQDKPEYFHLGDPFIRRISLEGQIQYLSRYANPKKLQSPLREKTPNLGKGLRFRNLDSNDYHDYEIHRDDAEEFVRRVNKYMIELGISDPSKVDNNYLCI